MSAYVVEPETIARIIAALQWAGTPGAGDFGQVAIMAREGWPLDTEQQRERLARAMWQMNVDAVCQRYEGRETPDRYPWPGLSEALHLSNVQGYKSLLCYLYQCTEGDVPERPLYKALDAASDRLAHGIVTYSKEYEKAEWG